MLNVKTMLNWSGVHKTAGKR